MLSWRPIPSNSSSGERSGNLYERDSYIWVGNKGDSKWWSWICNHTNVYNIMKVFEAWILQFNMASEPKYGGYQTARAYITQTGHPFCRKSVSRLFTGMLSWYLTSLVLIFIRHGTPYKFCSDVLISVSNRCKFVVQFQFRFHLEPDHCNEFYHTKFPDCCNWAGITNTNPAFQHYTFSYHEVSEFGLHCDMINT